jgi:hypothetical protein
LKKTLRTLLFTQGLVLTTLLNAQSIYFENFNSTTVNSIPENWIVSSNTKVQEYYNPGACTTIDKGLVTPAVGKHAPMGIILPTFTYDAANPYLLVNFKLFVYNANDEGKNCTVKPFPCPTLVEAYIVPASWNNETAIPTAGQFYASLPGYEIAYANANNTIVFNNIVMPSGVTQFKVLLNFKSSDGSCTSNGTKFVFDDFNFVKSNCSGTCTPITNNDYFNSVSQGFGVQLKGNVYGGYTLWSSQAPGGFEINSLSIPPADNNGTDYDINNSNLGDMTFTLVNGLTVDASSGCAGTVNPGTLTFNSNGTFTYECGSSCVTRVSFTYKTKNNSTNLESATSKVTIDLTAFIVLPVKFQSFTAVRNQQRKEQVLLKWETATEQNNRGFYVQRKVAGAWKNIAFVFSQADNGNSTIPLAYEYKEINAANTVSQYQIQQVDMDGKTSYSEVKAVPGIVQRGDVLIYPNPALNGKVNLLFKETMSTKDVTVIDANGRVVKQFRNIKDNSLTIEALQSGFYTIKTFDHVTSTTTVEKVILKQ